MPGRRLRGVRSVRLAELGVGQTTTGLSLPFLRTAGRSLSRLDRVAQLPPRVKSSGQGMNALDTPSSKEQRHPGATGFTWSRAVEDDLSISRDLLGTALDLVRG
jgi:hypothetical protein